MYYNCGYNYSLNHTMCNYTKGSFCTRVLL